jgi:hypothetical protein
MNLGLAIRVDQERELQRSRLNFNAAEHLGILTRNACETYTPMDLALKKEPR